MNNAMVLPNLETPKQTAAGSTNKVNVNARCEKTIKQDFKQLFENCTMIDASKQPALQLVELIYGGKEQTDNSMLIGSPVPKETGDIVSTLEGFELLDYQSDKNVSVTTEDLLNILGNAKTQSTSEDNNAFQAELMKGIVNNNEQENKLSGQLAGMRPNEQLNTQNVSQQEILQRVGTYLCSLESTNSDSVSSEIINADGIEGVGNIKIDSASKQDTLIESEGSEVLSSDAAVVKAEIAVADSRSFRLVDGTEVSSSTQEGQATSFESDNVLNIVDKVRTSAAEGKHDFDIQLKPEFLGKVNIKLTMESGSIKVQIKTDDSAVRGLVSENLISLQNTFEDKGVNVSNIDVLLDSQTFTGSDQQAFEQNNGNQHMQKRQITLDRIDSTVYDVITELPDVYMENSSVEFRA